MRNHASLVGFAAKATMVWLFFLTATLGVSAQQIDSVSWMVVDGRLIVRYDLDQQADIRVRVSLDGGHTYSAPIDNLQGDVGKDVLPGKGKEITADNPPEIRGIDVRQMTFLVEVDDGSAIIWLDTIPIVMMPVAGGTFVMGGALLDQSSRNLDRSLPVHEVTLDDYYIGRCEVTQQLWMAVMDENPSLFKGSDQLPVDQVSWNQVQVFIARLSQLTGYRFRLPTEAEWEYASRGGQRGRGYVYPGTNNGDSLIYYAWYCGNSASRTHPVGEKLPNELGLYDMGGNVAEWCHDWAANYSDVPQTNPRGPRRGENRILRGGSINSPSWTCSVNDRSWYLPDYSYGCYGFRLALDDMQQEID